MNTCTAPNGKPCVYSELFNVNEKLIDKILPPGKEIVECKASVYKATLHEGLTVKIKNRELGVIPSDFQNFIISNRLKIKGFRIAAGIVDNEYKATLFADLRK